jgi:cytochrome c-type biogenesis protein CcmH
MPRSLYYLGLHDAQSGDSAAALKRWQELEAKSPPNAPYLPVLRAEMARVAQAAGLPAGTTMPQPSREQQEAMAALTPEQRQQAIRGMVEGLAARLKENPQDRGGWLRLANAWKVLGDHAGAIDAYAKADALGPVDARVLADWAERMCAAEARRAAVAACRRGARAPGEGRAAQWPRAVLSRAASFAAGDKPAAARRWKTLLALLPADAPIRAMLEERIKAADSP